MSDDINSYKNMPPDRITIACFTYMVRVMELSDFSSFFFGIINESEGLSLRMAAESKKEFRDAAAKYQGKMSIATERFSAGSDQCPLCTQ
jgi:hypothetical protein